MDNKNDNTLDIISSIKELIDRGLERGISINTIDNKIYEHINCIKSREYKEIRKTHKKSKKKKKICRPALFISDSSDND